MNVDGLIERNGLARVASGLTLTSGPITDGVQLLISRRTVSRIDLVPMSFVKSAAGSNVSFDTSQKSSSLTLGVTVPTATPKMTTIFFVVTLNVIQKRMIMSVTTTGGVLGHYVKRTTHDNRTVFITTQIDQIVANSKRKCHLGNSCLRC